MASLLLPLRRGEGIDPRGANRGLFAKPDALLKDAAVVFIMGRWPTEVDENNGSGRLAGKAGDTLELDSDVVFGQGREQNR